MWCCRKRRCCRSTPRPTSSRRWRPDRVDAAAVDLSTVAWMAKRHPDKYADSGKHWSSSSTARPLRQGDPDWLNFVDTTWNVAMFGYQNVIFDQAIADFFGLKPPVREPGLPPF